MFGNSNPFPLSDAFLRRFSSKGDRHDYLKARMSRSRSFEQYDFNVQAVDTTNVWTVGAHSTSSTWAVLAEAGGWIRGGTGASVATGAVQLSQLQKYWTGTSGAGMAALIRMSAVTAVRVELGFADVLPAVGTHAVNLASNAFNSIASGVVYVFDVSTAITTGLYGIGTSTAFNSVATTTNRFASGVTMFVAIEIAGRNANLYLGDGPAPVATATNITTAADGLRPFIMATTLGGAKNIDLDAFWTWTNGRV